MPESLAVEPDTLEWSARLSAVLLNDATDAVRWFLEAHLPFKENNVASLAEVLQAHKQLLADLRDGRNTRKFINHEMFDILFREDGRPVNPGDLDLGLMFVLIRFLCQIKHPSWKHWDEEPQKHQTLPLFDVIRLVRFKEKMKDVVHKYHVTKESFDASWHHVTTVLDRLRCYKVSARRWIDDVMQNGDVTKAEGVLRELVSVMRWHTTELKKRDDIYLTLKESRRLKMKEGKPVDSWDRFISNFGQKRQMNLAALNEPKPTELTADVAVYSDIRRQMPSSALTLNSHCLQGSRTEGNSPKVTSSSNRERTQMMGWEKILEATDNSVYIPDVDHNDSQAIQQLTKCLKRLYITARGRATPLPSVPDVTIPMDHVTFNLSRLSQNLPKEDEPEFTSPHDLVLRTDDILSVTPGATSLKSWRTMLDSASSASSRMVVYGDWSSGKTLLLRKIGYEWATENCAALSSHRFAFHLDLALVKLEEPYTRLSDCILEQCVLWCSDEKLLITSDEIEDLFVQSKGAGILLLLDNFDRLPGSNNQQLSEFYDIINGHLWPKCSIIVTSSYLPNRWKKEKMAENLKHIVKKNSLQWNQYVVDGFTKYDVICNSRKFFDDCVDAAGSLAQFSDYAKVYQRDVYEANVTSPMMTYIMCKGWNMRQSMKKSIETNALQISPAETLSDVISCHFSKTVTSHSSSDSFCAEVLSRTLAGDSCNFYASLQYRCDFVKQLTKSGLMVVVDIRNRESDDVMEYFKFSHVLFENWVAARFASDHLNDVTGDLKSCVTSLCHAIRLRHFFQFCCSQNPSALVHVVEFLTTLLRSKIDDLKATDFVDSSEHEAIKLLVIQCIYEANASPQDIIKCMSPPGSNFLNSDIENPAIEIARTYNSDHKWPSRFRGNSHRSEGCKLQMKSASKLSYKSQQALIYFTRSCRPSLTPSGSVRAALVPTGQQFWIRSCTLSGLIGHQLNLAVLILRNLPFLEELYIPEARDVSDSHVSEFCSGIASHVAITSLLHTLAFTLDATSQYGDCVVSNYAELGDCLRKFQHLEWLRISFARNPKLFFSLFEKSESALHPISEVDLSSSGMTADECKELVRAMKCLAFVQRLDLSHNPLGNGVALVCDLLHQFRDLQVLNLQQTCLTGASLVRLSRAVCRPITSASLNRLDLGGNFLQDESAMAAFVKAVPRLKSLEYLDLSQNYVGDTSACVLAESLRNHDNLRTLHLDHIQVGTLALSSFKYHLGGCSKLEVLTLAGNYFDDAVLDFAGSFLRDNKDFPTSGEQAHTGFASLQKLDLSGVSENIPTKCSSQSVDLFIESIQGHDTLKEIYLLNIEVSSSDLVRLLSVCEKHSSISHIAFSSSLTPLTNKKRRAWKCLRVL